MTRSGVPHCFELQNSDAARVAELDRLARAEAAWSLQDWQGFIASGRAFGASVESPLDGFACFGGVVPEAELLFVTVHQNSRGKGLGKTLLSHALKELAQQGICDIFLEVSVVNASACALYQSLGFEPHGLRKAYYHDGSDASLMRLSLLSQLAEEELR